MKLWIDTKTGTFGMIEDLRIIDTEEACVTIEDLEGYPDSGIIDLGLDEGKELTDVSSQ